MKIEKRMPILIAMLLTAIIMGCSTVDKNTGIVKDGFISIYKTDAPVPEEGIKEVEIFVVSLKGNKITGVEMHGGWIMHVPGNLDFGKLKMQTFAVYRYGLSMEKGDNVIIRDRNKHYLAQFVSGEPDKNTLWTNAPYKRMTLENITLLKNTKTLQYFPGKPLINEKDGEGLIWENP